VDTAELWRQYRADRSPELREALVEEHLSLVKRIAGRMALVVPNSISLADLEGYGALGLLEAVERYDPDRGVPFPAYAITRVRGSILDGLRSMDPAPASWRQQARLLEKAVARLEERLGRSPDDEELAAELHLEPAELAEWERRAAGLSLVYLDQIRSGRDGEDGVEGSVESLAGDDPQADPLGSILRQDRQAALAEALERLSDKERLVVTLIYYEDLTAKEAAQVMGLSPSRVSQLHTRAILRLRGSLSRRRDRVL